MIFVRLAFLFSFVLFVSSFDIFFLSLVFVLIKPGNEVDLDQLIIFFLEFMLVYTIDPLFLFRLFFNFLEL